MAKKSSFLGMGLAFPPQVDPATGKFLMCGEDEDIRQSIYIILMTKKRERAMLPNFGCNLHDYVFELPDASIMAMLENEILESLALWEPRIIDISVGFDFDGIHDGKLLISIEYVVRATNNPYNLVFPYYLYEGIGVE